MSGASVSNEEAPLSAARSGPARLKVLTFTSLYPNSVRQEHGVFSEHRLRNLLATGRVETRVVTPVPWVPVLIRGSSRYGNMTRIPYHDQRFGIDISYPRYPVIPKIGMTAAPLLMAAAMVKPLRAAIRAGFDFDIIDAFYFYPDGVAAAILGRLLNKPVVITAYGTDLNLIPRHFAPRRMLLWASRQAAAMTAVCQALKDSMVEIGMEPDRVHVILHGVDTELFVPPKDRTALRKRLGLTRQTLVSVGGLNARKGHHIAIEAMRNLPEMDLLIAGVGELEEQLKAQVAKGGLGHRVRFLGFLRQDQLTEYYGAADALVLCSSREGIANVLLESMACGTPVVATPIWGTPEAVTVPEAGVLMTDRSAPALVEAARALFRAYPDRAATRRFAQRFSWRDTASQHLAVLEQVTGSRLARVSC